MALDVERPDASSSVVTHADDEVDVESQEQPRHGGDRADEPPLRNPPGLARKPQPDPDFRQDPSPRAE